MIRRHRRRSPSSYSAPCVQIDTTIKSTSIEIALGTDLICISATRQINRRFRPQETDKWPRLVYCGGWPERQTPSVAQQILGRYHTIWPRNQQQLLDMRPGLPRTLPIHPRTPLQRSWRRPSKTTAPTGDSHQSLRLPANIWLPYIHFTSRTSLLIKLEEIFSYITVYNR